MDAALLPDLMLLAGAGLWVCLLLWGGLGIPAQAGALLATVWNGLAAIVVLAAMTGMGEQGLSPGAPRFLGASLTQVCGQAVLLGALATLWSQRRGPLLPAVGALVLLLLFHALPPVAGAPAARLACALLLWAGAVVPGLLLGHWTATQRAIVPRSLLQATLWAAVLLWLLPTGLFANGLGRWPAAAQPDRETALLLLALAIPIGLLAAALAAFALEGNGTGFPFDPPRRLVTGGIYAWVSNPMQIGICLLVALWGAVLDSAALSGLGLVAVILFVVFRNVCNGSSAIGRNNRDWRIYQDAVPKWRPRLRRYRPVASGDQPAVL